MTERRLIGRKELGEKHPFLANQSRLRHLIRTKAIPFVRIGRGRGVIAFDEKEIANWIDERTQAEVG